MLVVIELWLGSYRTLQQFSNGSNIDTLLNQVHASHRWTRTWFLIITVSVYHVIMVAFLKFSLSSFNLTYCINPVVLWHWSSENGTIKGKTLVTVLLVSLCVFLNQGVHQLEWWVNQLSINAQEALQPTKRKRKLKVMNAKYVLTWPLMISWSTYGVRSVNTPVALS